MAEIDYGREAMARHGCGPAPAKESAPVPAGSTVKSSTADILRLVDAKLDPEVIKAYIKASPAAYDLGASEIIVLAGRGVSAEAAGLAIARDSLGGLGRRYPRVGEGGEVG